MRAMITCRRRGSGPAKLRCLATFLACLLAIAVGGEAQALTFRWAGTTEVQSLDPYTIPNAATRAILENIYEPLVARDRLLRPEPGLATAWTRTSDTVWRFTLRTDAHFQDGSPFSADDVVYSFHRATSGSSSTKSQLSIVADVRKIDDATVEIVTVRPNPLLPQSISSWVIMSQRWTEHHDPERQADGTGAFMLVDHRPGQRTILQRSQNWWGRPEHNVDRAVYFSIPAPDARVAALIQGKVDLIQNVVPADVARIDQALGFKILSAPQSRTVMLGFDQSRVILPDQPAKKQNPFKDLRVRKAISLAIDENAILQKVMHGFARAAGLVIGPGVVGFQPRLDRRPPFDPAVARTLMADAGYPKGFAITLDCSEGRYTGDRAICEAIVPMLADIGITATVRLWPGATYRDHIGPPDYDTQFFLLGWTPSGEDVLATLIPLAATRDPAKQRGLFNIGGFSYPAVDQLIDQIEAEAVPDKRQLLVDQAMTFIKNSNLYIPLHQEVVLWAARDTVHTQALANGNMPLRFVNLGPANMPDPMDQPPAAAPAK